MKYIRRVCVCVCVPEVLHSWASSYCLCSNWSREKQTHKRDTLTSTYSNPRNEAPPTRHTHPPGGGKVLQLSGVAAVVGELRGRAVDNRVELLKYGRPLAVGESPQSQLQLYIQKVEIS